MAKVALRLRRSREKKKLIIEENRGWSSEENHLAWMQWRRRRRREKREAIEEVFCFTIDKLGNGNEIMMVIFVVISFASSLLWIHHLPFVIYERRGRGEGEKYLQSSLFGWRTTRESVFFFIFKNWWILSQSDVFHRVRERDREMMMQKERKKFTCEKNRSDLRQDYWTRSAFTKKNT